MRSNFLSRVHRGIKRRIMRLLNKPVPLYFSIAADITNDCNIRCPFCFSTFGAPRVNMTPDHFVKALSLTPLVAEGMFLISCAFEPTIHPEFNSMLDLISPHLGSRAILTTNLLAPDPDTIHRLAELPIHHLNVSVDSLEAQSYESLRRGGRFERFEENLHRLCDCRKISSRPVPMFGISVVTRRNRPFLKDMGYRLADLGFVLHEVRDLFLDSATPARWKSDSILTDEDWDGLMEELSDASPILQITPPLRLFERYAGHPRLNPYQLKYIQTGVGLRIEPEGRVLVQGTDRVYHLSDIDDPLAFFTREYPSLARIVAP